MNRYFSSVLTTDYRSLAFFRVGLGLIAVVDGIFRFCDLTAHYSDKGVISVKQAMVVSHQSGIGAWSLAFLSGSPAWAGFILISLIVCGIGLAIGYKTRLMTFVCWVMAVSIQLRNPFVLNGGDVLYRLLLFWSLWLPLGKVWSIDAKKHNFLHPGEPVFVTPVIFQLCVVYWFSALFKSHPIWRIEESALDHVAHLGSYTYRWVEFLWDKPVLSRWLTRLTLWFEESGPALLFVPFWRGSIRTLLVLSFSGFHLFGIAGLMNIGLFPAICTVAWLAVIPAEFWDRMTRLLHLPSRVGVAVSRMPKTNATHLGMNTSGWMLYLAMLLVAFNNVITLNPPKLGWLMRRPLKEITNILHLNQRWRLFANRPMTRDGWFIVEAHFVNGEVGDLLRQGSPVAWDRPKQLREHYSNTRWRKLWLNAFHHRQPYVVNGLHDFLKHEWDETHSDNKVRDLKIYFILEDYLYPEDNGQRITIFPIAGFDLNGKAIFEGDMRRNEELKLDEQLTKKEW